MDRNTIDARGARIALMMYLRWLWVPVIALAAGFFVGGTFSTFEGPSSDASANITVGLTEEVRWPFFDAVLSRQSGLIEDCLLYTSPSPRDKRQSRMPSSA